MSPLASLVQFAALRRNVWRPPEALAELQAAKLRRMVHHAAAHVPYYRDLFHTAGVRPTDIRTPGDLAALPMTTRAVLQSLPTTDRVAAGVDVNHCLSVTTSGSSGVPLMSTFSEQDDFFRSVVMVRALMELGYRPTERYALIRMGHQEDEPIHWFQRLGLFRVRILYALDPIDSLYRQLLAYRPGLIAAYPSVLRLLADHEANVQTRLRPRRICAAGEVLDAATRRHVSHRLGVPVRNIYSAVECGNIAFECEHGALHLNADNLVVECLVGGKPARPGETGEVVVTTLDMYSAPLIRYRLGDLAVPGDGLCACGRGLPWLRAVTGRTIDCIGLSGGQTIPGTAFGEAIFKDVRSVRQYRITQRSLAHFAIELVPGSGFSDETETAIRRRCHETAGMDVQVDLACVACIPREPNGKARYVVSRVSGGRP